MDNVGNCLCIGSGARSAAVNAIMDFGKLVCYSVGNVGTSGCTRIGTDDNAVGVSDCHDRCLEKKKGVAVNT